MKSTKTKYSNVARESSQVVHKGHIRNRPAALLASELDLMNKITRRRGAAARADSDLKPIDAVELRPDKRTRLSLHKAAARPPAAVRVEAAESGTVRGANGCARREIQRACAGR